MTLEPFDEGHTTWLEKKSDDDSKYYYYALVRRREMANTMVVDVTSSIDLPASIQNHISLKDQINGKKDLEIGDVANVFSASGWRAKKFGRDGQQVLMELVK